MRGILTAHPRNLASKIVDTLWQNLLNRNTIQIQRVQLQLYRLPPSVQYDYNFSSHGQNKILAYPHLQASCVLPCINSMIDWRQILTQTHTLFRAVCSPSLFDCYLPPFHSVHNILSCIPSLALIVIRPV